MASLKLYFTRGTPPTLEKTEFIHNRTIVAVRGKSGGALRVNNTFQWSPAVRALVLLVLRTVLFSRRGKFDQAMLSGEAATPAASLDYAISKSTGWLMDIFGVDGKGIPTARRLIKRSNPERKRPGPVTLALNENILASTDIEISVEGIVLDDERSIAALLSAIERAENPLPVRQARANASNSRWMATNTADTAAAHLPVPFDRNLWLTRLKRVYRREISSMLRETHASNHAKIYRELSRTMSLPSLRRLETKAEDFTSFIDLELRTARHALKVPPSAASLCAPGSTMRVSMVPVHSGAMAIFKSLQVHYGLPMHYDYHWITSSHLAVELAAERINPRPEMAVVNIGAAAWFFRQPNAKAYRPLMIMPSFSNRIVCPITGDQINIARGTYHLMYEIPSTSGMMFEELEDQGQLSSRRAVRRETDMSHIGMVLRSGDDETKAILPFPMYEINGLFNNCEWVKPAGSQCDHLTVLLVREDVFHDTARARQLAFIIRDAWQRLIDNGQQFEDTIQLLTEDREQMSFIMRVAGLEGWDFDVPAAA